MNWTAGGAHRIDPVGVTGWVNDFDVPLLNQLVEEAVNKSFSLSAARSRVFQAEERARATRAGLFPQLELGQNSSRSQTLANRGQVQNRRHTFDLNMRWEIDLWGRLHDLKESQVALMDAEFFAYEAARLSLAARVIQAVFELVESKEQIALIERNLDVLEQNLEILDDRLEAGDADERTALDIALSRSEIAREKALLVAEKRQMDAARRTLETLLNRYPKGLIEGINQLPDLKASIPVGLPSQLLLRRPDILQAEMRINSELFGVSFAHKQALPSLSLSGSVGTVSNDSIFDLLDIDNLVYNIARNLTQPVFQGGEIKSDIRLAEHERDEAINVYANTVLDAFREVETALAAEKYFNEQIEALEKNVEEAELAESLSEQDYEKGIVGIITLLEAQQRLFNAQSTLLNIRLQRLLNRVDLYLALGGDFKTQVQCVALPIEEEKRFKRLNKILDWYRAEERPSGDARRFFRKQ